MPRKHAVVIGGSIAGFCTARVLSKHFDEVTVIEQDELPSVPAHRPGVPQSHHGHALLLRGQLDLEALFPGLESKLVARGARQVAFSADFAIRHRSGWAPRLHGFKPIISCSRQLLDLVIRVYLEEFRNITIRQASMVTELLIDKATPRGRVLGVRTASRRGEGSCVIHADLVVDASGRGSKAPKWFSQNGLPVPREEVVDPHGGYASRFYRMPTSSRPSGWWWQGIWIEPSYPDTPRSGALLPIEDDGWLITACGFSGDLPPQDEPGWLAFLSQLISPAIANAARHAMPVSEIVCTRTLYSRLRRYETWPAAAGFLAIGDSVCALNPLYAQGITISVACARRLDEALKMSPREDFASNFFTQQAEFVRTPWELSTSADMLWPKTKCSVSIGPLTALRARYLQWCAEAFHFDPRVLLAYGRVRHMIDSVEDLYRPAMLLRVTQSVIAGRLKSGHRTAPLVDAMPPEHPAAMSLA